VAGSGEARLHGPRCRFGHNVHVDAVPPEHPWLHEKLAIQESAIEGKGLFATEDLPADLVVIRLAGRLVSSLELASLIDRAKADPSVAYVDTLTIYEDVHLVLPPATKVHFGNHSCDPNLWHVGPYDIATRRRVAAGEELTIDYGTQSGASGFSMTCHCGSPHCRSVISSNDWRLRYLQDRYRNHWVPALEERISGT
jgi:SET domain-containing protein